MLEDPRQSGSSACVTQRGLDKGKEGYKERCREDRGSSIHSMRSHFERNEYIKKNCNRAEKGNLGELRAQKHPLGHDARASASCLQMLFQVPARRP